MQFWKRKGKHFTFKADPSVVDHVFARKSLAGRFELSIEEVGR